ncbi:ribosomal biogenesis factor [Syngnathoides biaculeatus]|uniref:ribosomal biogenesis factor n=1 Tax=Syngnathoides biaculeatus TaxID=300417 RepID=UPI002ADD8527|nr:ribosomal biogenesis factor [Syngnathoides biaculeatus]XP_061661194.1 ribosomal biogenesis factor [Syngnathoides biaculeatus]
MGKNKEKGKKRTNVFQVAANKHLKAKNKAKAVRTTLKRINSVKNEKVEKLNQMFSEVQKDVSGASKRVASQAEKRPPQQIVKEPPKEAANVDCAAQLLSQL